MEQVQKPHHLLDEKGTEPSLCEERCYKEPFSRMVTIVSQPGLQDDLESRERKEVHAAPDGGWGWMVVAAAFTCCTILGGIIFSFGLLLVHLENYYGSLKGEIAWCGSLITGMMYFSGPVAAALSNKYGVRTTAIAGSLLSTSGFLLSTASPNVWLLYLTYGIMGGFGFGMIYVSLVVSVGCYFTTKRGLATGIALTGSGMGGFLFPPLTEALLSIYDWRGAVTIIAGIMLQCAVCGSIMRPLHVGRRPAKQCLEKRQSSDWRVCDEAAQPLQDMCPADGTILNTEPGVHSMDSLDNLTSNVPRRCCYHHSCATTSQCSNSYVSVPICSVSKTSNVRKFSMGNAIEDDCKTCSKMRPGDPDIASLDEDRAELKACTLGGCSLSKSKSPRPVLSSMLLVSETDIDSVCKAQHSPSSSKKSIEVRNGLPPEDTCYEEVAGIVHEFVSKSRPVGCYSGLLRTKRKISGESVIDRQRSKIPRSKFGWLVPDLDFILLKDISFLLTCIANTVGLMGYYIPFMYLTDSSIAKGITRDKAAFLISITGITNICGKIVLSVIIDCPRVRAMDVNNVCLLVSGICAAAIPFCWSYAELVAVAAVFNFFGGVIISIIPLVLVEMVGVGKLTSSFGFMNMFRGIGAMIGSPIAGSIFDATKSYDIPFFLCGGLLLLSSLLTLSLPLLNCCHQREWNRQTMDERRH